MADHPGLARAMGEPQKSAWADLKAALANPEVLAAPIRGAAKRVMTDASGYGLGGVLLQVREDGKWQSISFTSRSMRQSERNSSPTERECLAVVHALQKWRHYLHGELFTVITDHLSLKWLLSLQDPREKLARWAIQIQDLDFKVEHRNGPELVIPDTLSRDAVPKPLCQRCYQPLEHEREEEVYASREEERVSRVAEHYVEKGEKICAIRHAQINGNGPTKDELREAQAAEFGEVNAFVKKGRELMVDDEGIVRSTRQGEIPAWLPRSLVREVLEYVHGTRLTGHYKLHRTLARLKGKYAWKGMAKNIAAHTRDCLQCVVSEDRQPPRQALMLARHPKTRFEQVSFDVQTITPETSRGNKKVLVFVDVFTRFAKAVPIKNEKAETIAEKLLDEWIATFGPMEYLVSDGGTSMVARVVNELTSKLGIGRIRTFALHPQANSTVDRWNRTLARDLSSFMTTGGDDWD